MDDNDLSVLIKFGESLFVDTTSESEELKMGSLEGKPPVWFMSPHCNTYPPTQPAVTNLKGCGATAAGFTSFSSSSAHHFDPQGNLQNYSHYSGGGITESSFAAMTTNNHSVAFSHTMSNTKVQRVFSVGTTRTEYDGSSPVAAYLNPSQQARVCRSESAISTATATSFVAASGAPWATTAALSSHTFFTPNNSNPQFHHMSGAFAPRRTRAKGFCVSERPWAAPSVSPLIAFYDQEVAIFSGDLNRIDDCRAKAWGLLCIDGTKDQVLPTRQTMEWIMGILSNEHLNQRSMNPTPWSSLTLKDVETGSRIAYRMPTRPRNGRTIFEQNSTTTSSASATHNGSPTNSSQSPHPRRASQGGATPTPISPVMVKGLPQFQHSQGNLSEGITSSSANHRPSLSLEDTQTSDMLMHTTRPERASHHSSSSAEQLAATRRASTAPFEEERRVHMHSNTNVPNHATGPRTPPPIDNEVGGGHHSTAPLSRHSVPSVEELSNADGFELLIRQFCSRVNETSHRARSFSQLTRSDTLSASIVLFSRLMHALATSIGKSFVEHFQNWNMYGAESACLDLLPNAEYTWTSAVQWVPEKLGSLRAYHYSLPVALEACLQIVKIEFDSVKPPGTSRSNLATNSHADPQVELMKSYRDHIFSTLQYDIIAVAPQMYLEPLDWCTVATRDPNTYGGQTNTVLIHSLLGYTPRHNCSVFSYFRSEVHTAVNLLMQHSSALESAQHTTWIAGAALIATVMRLVPERFTPSVVDAYLHNLESRYGEHVSRCVNVAYTILKFVYARHHQQTTASPVAH